jgi:S1-C subfamily serine protease
MGRGTWSRKVRRTMAALTMGVALIVSGAWAGTAKAADNEELPQVIAKTTPAVVAIIGKPSASDGASDKGWEQNRFNLAHGTGVIVQPNGVIVTNAHVVKDMNNLIVVTSDGKSYPGRATNIDEESDLALVKIDATGLPTATLAASGDIKVGETVAAIGTPISFALRNSVTVGIVSGIDRSISSQYQLIQTDAAINPGNSGGALVNMKGEVVGINSMKFASYGVENLGFAIPIDTVRYVLDHFQKYGKVKRPYLGVELEESWEAVVGLPSAEGLRVSYVDADSPAAKAGIQEGDQLTAVGGKPVNSLAEYHEVLKTYLPDDNVTLTIKNTGGQTSKTVKLGEDTTTHSELAAADGSQSDIDSDRGKTRIGDSHFGWSMKYPAGLVKNDQSSDGTDVSFEDAKGEFSLGIQIKDMNGSELSVAGLFAELADHSGDTVLERKYVKQDKGPSYVKLVSKSSSGSYSQSRAYQKDGSVFIITLAVHDEETYSNKSKLNSFIDLLNSFDLSFDKNNTALKDISVFKSGGSRVSNAYGLSVELPADWNTEGRESGSFFMSGDFRQYVSMEVTSASAGETLDDWLSRAIKAFEDSYAADYRTTGEVKDVTIAGVPAKTVETSWTLGGDWNASTTILFIKDKYKYEIEIGYRKNDDNQNLVKSIIDSIRLDKDAADPNVGFIQDIKELADPGKTIKYHSGKYKYSFSVPETWYSTQKNSRKDKEPDTVSYSFGGGSFTVRADSYGKLENVIKDRESSYKKNAGIDSDYKYSETDETVFGADAKKFELQYATNKIPYHSTEYVFSKNNIVYTVTLRINDAMRTEANLVRLQKAFESMSFDE